MELNIWWCVAIACAGLILGYIVGRVQSKKVGISVIVGKLYNDLDNLIMCLSGIMLVGSICFAAAGKLEVFAATVINMFSSVIFSWILTKKSSKTEFKKQEEELALRSYRHINYIETAANTANSRIDRYIKEHPELEDNVKQVLISAMDQIKYIQKGINTCKWDWHDMMSDEQKGNYACDAKYGGMAVVLDEAEYNQDDV